MRLAIGVLGCLACAPGTDSPGATETEDTQAVTATGGTTTPAGTTSGTPPVLTDCQAAGFEAPTLGLSGSALWEALAEVTQPQTCQNYGDATDFMFLTLDNAADSVTCVYTGRTTPVTTQKPDPTDMNTEHTWPQSLGADVIPAKCDLHHLFPCDSDANNRRAAYPFGEVVGEVDWDSGGSSLGLDASGATVFEPRDDHKGNVARAMLYVSARHGFPIDADAIALFQTWHQQDPVDDAELARTWAIAEEQVLPNPLVVCPELVERLSGT